MKRETQATNSIRIARRNAAVPRGVGHSHAIFIAKGENAEVWDVEGNRYIDFAGGIAVLNTGHRSPAVIDAVKVQLDKYTHTCFQVLAYEPYVELAERLNAKAPGDFAKKTLLLTTGAEALENSVRRSAPSCTSSTLAKTRRCAASLTSFPIRRAIRSDASPAPKD